MKKRVERLSKRTINASFEEWLNKAKAHIEEIENMLNDRSRYLASISTISKSDVSKGYKNKCLVWARHRFLKKKVKRRFEMPDFDPAGFKKWSRNELSRMIRISKSCRMVHSELIVTDDKAQEIKKQLKQSLGSNLTDPKINNQTINSLTTKPKMWLQN